MTPFQAVLDVEHLITSVVANNAILSLTLDSLEDETSYALECSAANLAQRMTDLYLPILIRLHADGFSQRDKLLELEQLLRKHRNEAG